MRVEADRALSERTEMSDKPRHRRHELTRRDFARLSLTAPLAFQLSACSSSDADAPERGDVIPAGAVLLGLYAADGRSALQRAARRLDFSWLGRGDSVLIKVAANSGFPHPMTTSVSGVIGLVQELKARGAGRVIVADQSGVEHVRSSRLGRYGSTRASFAQSGLQSVEQASAELHFFDEQPFDTGYFRATLPAQNLWPRGLWLPNILKEVDHVVYMPRIGAHVLAGNTLAQKMAIGWLRDDSRHDLHNDAEQFYEKFAEVSFAEELKSRLRLTVTVSEKVLLHGGPDHGTPYGMTPVLVHASTDLVNHDALGASMLRTLNQQVTTVADGAMVYNSGSAPIFNRLFANGAAVATGDAGPWVSESPQTVYKAHAWEQDVSGDRALVHGWTLAGGKPERIAVVSDGATLEPTLKNALATHGGGLYDFV
jgi:uncharacterized protein (DUF362 family)